MFAFSEGNCIGAGSPTNGKEIDFFRMGLEVNEKVRDVLNLCSVLSLKVVLGVDADTKLVLESR
jgi:hypothetical protein